MGILRMEAEWPKLDGGYHLKEAEPDDDVTDESNGLKRGRE